MNTKQKAPKTKGCEMAPEIKNMTTKGSKTTTMGHKMTTKYEITQKSENILKGMQTDLEEKQTKPTDTVGCKIVPERH